MPDTMTAAGGAAAFDLALALDWEYDWDFVRLVEASSRDLGLRTCTVSPPEAAAFAAGLASGGLAGRILFDRASGATPDFLALQRLALERGWDVIEPVEKLRWASDKATMHLEFISHGLHTPHTLILPALETAAELRLRLEDLLPLGSPFIVKPANTTGGSVGVIDNACSLADIAAARLAYPRDKYLIQEKVVPEFRDGRRFWFRGFYVLGEVTVVWWDDRTHLYGLLLPQHVAGYGLEPLFAIVRAIADISGLRFFSTEIALDARGRFLAVDYVNENCDMRLQSRHPDGVPDTVVRKIAQRIASYAYETRPAGPDGS